MINKDEIRKDFLAFADDDSDVLFDVDGNLMFHKNGTEMICRVHYNEGGHICIEYNGQSFPYRTFFAKQLARLDIFAKKILEKRKRVDAFVDSPAILKSENKTFSESALKLLERECDNFLEFGSKITFITADAGHGKSALLREFQYLQAQKYSQGNANYIFWHVDLQGRDLVRLPEAIMYDLGELRIPGLYYSSIINLIRKRFIILAIDGFDELAAEIGGMNAISSLSSFVNEMEGQGTLIAASRRTFFDTHDYLKRTSLLKNKVTYDIVFDELKLKGWTQKEDVAYFSNLHFDNPEHIYSSLLTELHGEVSHPILTRPFLLAKFAAGIDGDAANVALFFSKNIDEKEGVAVVVEAFTDREVDKWKERDNQTGRPYLTFDQHIELLATIAKEMWESKRDFVTIEEIELHTLYLLDEWKIEESIRHIIIRLVGSHAFLLPTSESKFDVRKFDHEEFKNYFLARALATVIEKCTATGESKELKKFLYVDQLPDSVALYCFNYVHDLNSKVIGIIETLKNIVKEEWKPTYLQMNVGTLFPYILDKVDIAQAITLDAKVSYSSLIFENKDLKNITFENANFINISLRATTLTNVHFRKCTFNEIKIEIASRNSFQDISFADCDVNSIALMKDGEIDEIAFSPKRIHELLSLNNIKIDSEIFATPAIAVSENSVKSDFRKALNRFLLKFNIITIQYERNIDDERHYGTHTEIILNEVIPLLIQYELLEEIENRQTKQSNKKAWRLAIDLEQLMRHDGDTTETPLAKFWLDVNSRNGK